MKLLVSAQNADEAASLREEVAWFIYSQNQEPERKASTELKKNAKTLWNESIEIQTYVCVSRKIYYGKKSSSDFGIHS